MPCLSDHSFSNRFAEFSCTELAVGVGQLQAQCPGRVEPSRAVTGEMRQAKPICSATPRPILSGCTSAANCSATWDWANRTDSAACNAGRRLSFSSRAIRSIRSASEAEVVSVTAVARSANISSRRTTNPSLDGSA